MPITSHDELLAALRAHRLLPEDRVEAIRTDLTRRFPEPRQLAQELMQRGWLTAFQVNYVLQGRGGELVFGQYVLLERLGQGGMGAVYKARHRRLDRLVALKVIRPELVAHPHAVKRFQREARAAAQLSHPNVVAILDADEQGSTHYLVMEYVEGIDLGSLLKDAGPLPIAQACHYVRQAAEGLQHLHERGLVHRDVKPSNLLLTADGKTVKVLDLGLALLDQKDQDPAQKSALTRVDSMMGTADYVAPEQALDAHRVDIRADLYSLGCTLYHLLVGHPPFPEGVPMQKVACHLHATPPPVKSLRPEVPSALAALIDKLMAKKPEDRVQTPAELVEALAPFARNAPTPTPSAMLKKPLPPADKGSEDQAAHATVDSKEGRTLPVARVAEPAVDFPPTSPDVRSEQPPAAPSFWRRFRLPLIVLAGLILVGAFVVPPLLRKDEPGPQVEGEKKPGDPPVKPPDDKKVLLPPGKREEVPPPLAGPTVAKRVAEVHKLLLDKKIDEAMVEADAALAEAPDDAGAIYAKARALEDRGISFMDRATTDPARAVEVLTECLRLKPEFRTARFFRAVAYRSLKRWRLALEDFNECLRLEPADSAVRVHLYSYRGDHYAERGLKSLARRDYETGLAAARSHTDPTAAGWADYARKKIAEFATPSLPRLNTEDEYFLRARDLRQKGDWAKAIEDYDVVLTLNPKRMYTHHNRGNCYVELEEYEAALEDFQTSLRLQTHNAHQTWAAIARLYDRRGMYDQVVAAYTEAIKFRKDDDVGPIHGRGLAYLNLNKVDEALADAEETIRLNPKSADGYNLRGRCLSLKGDQEGALASLNKAVELDPMNGWHYFERAGVHIQFNDTDKALEDSEKAVELIPNTSVAYVRRASSWLNKARKTGNEALYNNALADCNKAIELDPNGGWQYQVRAATYFHLSDYDKAAADLTRALRFNYNSVHCLRQRAECYDKLNDKARADADRKRADLLERKP